MAIVKHISIKNSNYDAATDYLTMQHNEFTNKPILDDAGNEIPRDFYLLDGINCDPFSFNAECQAINAKYGKNRTRSEIKAHHYIISFDSRDRDENGLTPEHAQEIGMEFARNNFPGHQTIVCTHRDGHNSAGNIHVHIVINSVRKLDVEMQDFMERPGDALAGHKHHVTKSYMNFLKQSVMDLCQREDFYQVDLLSPAKVRITDREYWAKRRGQTALDHENKEKEAAGIKPERTTYTTEKEELRTKITTVAGDSHSFEEFTRKMLVQYGISVHESRGCLSYLPADRNKPIRARMLGTDFEKKHLEEIFKNYRQKTQKHFPYRPSRKHKHVSGSMQPHAAPAFHGHSIRLIVDVETLIKAQQNRYYAEKVKIGNLQQMANTLAFLQENGIGSEEELTVLLASTKADVDCELSELKETEAQLRKTNLLIRNTGQYLANKAVYKEYLNAPDKQTFRREHESSILLYEAARKELRELSGGKKIPMLKQLKSKKAALVAKKNEQYESYSFAKSKLRELQTVEQNVRAILETGREQEIIKNQERGS